MVYLVVSQVLPLRSGVAIMGLHSRFRVDYDGNLTATNANITGKITATSGSFPASLITGTLTANQINVSTLSAISANLGTITAGKHYRCNNHRRNGKDR